jgi:hypothetical protein
MILGDSIIHMILLWNDRHLQRQFPQASSQFDQRRSLTGQMEPQTKLRNTDRPVNLPSYLIVH